MISWHKRCLFQNVKKSEFKKTDLDKKIQIVLENGYYIDKRETRDFSIDLYSLDSFFIEVLYSSVNKWIEDIEVVDNQMILDLYLKEIQLNELY